MTFATYNSVAVFSLPGSLALHHMIVRFRDLLALRYLALDYMLDVPVLLIILKNILVPKTPVLQSNL